MPVQVKLSRIIISDLQLEQVIYLKEVDGDRQFPIVIAHFEATNIDRRVRGAHRPPRPQTYDLLVKVIEQLGGEPHSVLITELRNGTFYAHLRIRKEGELVSIDSRPSDAIAVAVTCQPHLPIFVNDDVLDDVLNN